MEDAGRHRLDSPLLPARHSGNAAGLAHGALDRLAPVKEVAQIGAAIGRDFSYTLLRCVAGRDDLALTAALRQLEEAELLLRRGTPPEAIYSFKHALVQEALTRVRSRAAGICSHALLAMSCGISFQSSPKQNRKSWHTTSPEAGLSQAALEWWRKAGQQALKRSAYSEAIAHLGKAVIADELPDEPGGPLNRLHLQIAYGRALRGSLAQRP